MKIALLGSSGYVGSSIYKKLNNHNVVPINRGTIISEVNKDIELVIHSANPAKRYLANSNPIEDFKETVEKTKTIVKQFKGKPLLLISSISCRTQKNSTYGLNRIRCEDLVLNSGGVVFRLGPMFGGNREKDIIHDIANNNTVYHSKKTKYAYCDIDWVTKYVSDNLFLPSGIYEIGAKNTISLERLASTVNSKSNFVGDIDDQYPLDFLGGPDAYDSIEYLKSIRG